jgi:hypothetical protein
MKGSDNQLGDFEKSLALFEPWVFVRIRWCRRGYSSFDIILKIKPNYIKIDMGATHDVQTDIVKQQIVNHWLVLAIRSMRLSLPREYKALKNAGP